MAAQRHEISLRVLKNISRVSPPFELFYDEFKVTKCCTKTFCLCWVLRSKIAFMRCVTFSNVLYVFGLSWIWRTKFFPTSWSAVFSHVWRRSIFKFCVYKFAEAVRYLKFKWEFVIIGRGCLVLLKFKSSLCWRMLCFKLSSAKTMFLYRQWIIILKTFELVTLSFSPFHAQRNWLLTHTLHIFN